MINRLFPAYRGYLAPPLRTSTACLIIDLLMNRRINTLDHQKKAESVEEPELSSH